MSILRETGLTTKIHIRFQIQREHFQLNQIILKLNIIVSLEVAMKKNQHETAGPSGQQTKF